MLTTNYEVIRTMNLFRFKESMNPEQTEIAEGFEKTIEAEFELCLQELRKTKAAIGPTEAGDYVDGANREIDSIQRYWNRRLFVLLEWVINQDYPFSEELTQRYLQAICEEKEKNTLTQDEQIEAKYESGQDRLTLDRTRLKLPFLRDYFRLNYRAIMSSEEDKPWDDVTKSRLIESFLLNLPVPPVIVSEGSDGVREIIDGQKRVKAILEFYHDQLVLSGLEAYSELNGLTYSELSRNQGRFDRRNLNLISIVPMWDASPDEKERLIKIVAERLNS